jgi:hypothetical protein
MGICYGKPKDTDIELKENEKEKDKENDHCVHADEHEGKKRNMTFHYTIEYPLHEPRKNSNLYNRTHYAMKDIPCFICKKHGIETHHYYIEWAASNAIDWKEFGEAAKFLYNPQTGENINHFDWDEVAKNPEIFVDSRDNMITLCKKHHTSVGTGIHRTPYSEWFLQKVAKNGFIFLS